MDSLGSKTPTGKIKTFKIRSFEETSCKAPIAHISNYYFIFGVVAMCAFVDVITLFH